MRAAIYVRVSTDEQANEGFSIPAQRDRLGEFCRSQGWNVIDEYIEEGWSAKNTERPELQRLLRDVSSGHIDVVVVYRLDRLTRSVLDLYTLLQTFEQHKVHFKSATEVYDTTTAIGRLFITLVAALAQWERENLGERVVVGMEQMAKQGKRPGAPAPFGYRYLNGELDIEPINADIICKIYKKYLTGSGIRAIKTYLEQELKVLTPTGNKEWNVAYIRYVLSNPVYIGKIKWSTGTDGESVFQGSHEPIIDEFTFRRAQEIRDRRKDMAPRHATGQFPLSGILYCGKCGSKMSGKRHMHKAMKEPIIYYRCQRKANSQECDMRYIRSDELEPKLVTYLDHLFSDKEHLEKIITMPEVQSNKNIEKQAYQDELNGITQKKKRWFDAYEVGAISIEELKERTKTLSDRERYLYSQLSEKEVQQEPKRWSAKDLIEQYSDFEAQWDKAQIEERKELIHSLFEFVQVQEDLSIQFKFR